MTNPSDDGAPAAVPLFTYTIDKLARSLAPGEKPTWRYPCGLCNAGTVTEPGALCADCAPSKPPKKPRKRSSTKTPAKKTAVGRRVPPWDRVADQPDDSGAARSGKRGDS